MDYFHMLYLIVAFFYIFTFMSNSGKLIAVFSLLFQQCIKLFCGSDPPGNNFENPFPETPDGVLEIVVIQYFAHDNMIRRIIALLFAFMAETVNNGYLVYNLLGSPLNFPVSSKFIVP